MTTLLLPTGSLSGYSIQLMNNTTQGPVGHSYITITGPDGTQHIYGFAPANPTGATVIGPGAVTDNSTETFTTSTNAQALTPNQYNALSQFVNNSIQNPPEYNALLGQECTAWAMQAIDTAFGTPNGPVIPTNFAEGVWETLLYNPFTSSAEIDASNFLTIINAKLDAVAQYGQGLLNGLSAGGSSPTTLNYSDGSSLTIQPTSSGGSVLLTDPSGHNGGSLQYFLNQGSPICTVTDPTGSGLITGNGQTLSYAAGNQPILTFDATGAMHVSFSPTASAPSVTMTSGGVDATVDGLTFSQTVANLKIAVDAANGTTFSNNAGQLLQSVAPDSEGVTQSLYSSSVVDQLTQKNFYSLGGPFKGSATYAYSTNPADTWSSVTTMTNSSGQILGYATVNRDGTSVLQRIDPTTGNPIVTTDIDAQGQTTAQAVNATANYPAFVQAIADTLAAQLISRILIQNDLPASIAAQAFADAVIKSELPTAGQNLTFAQAFAQSTFDIAGGIAGSQAGALVADALGLPGEFGTLTGGVTGNLVTQALVNEASQALGITNASTSVLTVANFAGGLGGAGGIAVGSALAGLIFTPTLAGEVTGAVAAAAELANTAELIEILSVSNPITAVLTAFSLALGSDFIGNIIGDIFGGLFGGHPSVGPNATAIVLFDGPTQRFYPGASAADNGGDVTIAQNLANATIDSLNSVLTSIGGTVSGTPFYGLGYFRGLFFAEDINDGNPDEYQQNQYANAIDAVGNAGFRALHQIQVKGGNPYMVYALQHSDATTYAGLLNDLGAARDYSLYLANPLAFDLALAMSGDPNQLTTWQTELARAHTLGLDQLTAGQLQSLNVYGAVVTPSTLGQVGADRGVAWNFDNSFGVSHYLRDNATGQVSVVTFDAAGNVISAEALTTSTGAQAFIGATDTVIGAGYNFAGTNGHDYFIRANGTNQLTAREYNSSGVLTYDKALTTSTGAAFTVSTLTNVIGTGYNFGGQNGHDIFARDLNTQQVVVYEFNSAGQVSYTGSLTTNGTTPFTTGGQFDVLGTTTNFAGTGGRDIFGYDTGTSQFSISEFNSSGVLVYSHVLAGMGGSPFAIDVKSTIVGSAHNIIGTGNDLITQAPSGQIIISEFTAAGQQTASLTLINSNGSPLVLSGSPTILATKTNFAGVGDHDLFIKDISTGQLLVAEFTSAGQQLVTQGLTNSNGSVFTLASGSTVVATAHNFMGHSGNDIIVESSTGVLSFYEFDATGKVVGTLSSIYNPDTSGPLTLATGTQLIGTMSNYMGDGGFDIVYQTPDKGITLYELDGVNGQIDDGFWINTQSGSNYLHYYAPTTVSLLGTSNNVLGTNNKDMIFQEPDGTVLTLEMAYYGTIKASAASTAVGLAQNFLGTGGSDKIVANNSNQNLVVLEYNAAGMVASALALRHDTAGGGGLLSMGSGELVVGSAQNDFNLGGKDLIFWTTDGHLTNYEFNTSTGKIIDGFYLNNTSYQPLTFAAGTTVLGAAQNFLGHSGSDFFIKSPTGVVTAYEYTGYGTVGWTQAETVINGNAAGNQTFSGTATSLNHNIIFNFNGSNDAIDITGHAYNSNTTVTYAPMAGTNSQTGMLTIKDGTTTLDVIELIGGSNIASFHVASDGSGGILVTDPPTGAAPSGPVATAAVIPAANLPGFNFAQAEVAFRDGTADLGSRGNDVTSPAPVVSSDGDQFIFHANSLTLPLAHNAVDALSLNTHAGVDDASQPVGHALTQAIYGMIAHALPTSDDLSPQNPNLQTMLHVHDGFHLT
jgi:hypothetical protein